MLAWMLATAAHAQSAVCSSIPCSTMHTVAATDQAVPLEYSFNIGTPGTYQVTLIDLGAQAPLNAPLEYVKLGITGGSSLVGAPLVAPGSVQFTASPGTYVIHVTGKPGPGIGSGPVGIEVASAAGGTPIATFSGTLATPPGPLPSGESVLSDTFTVASAGTYEVALNDLGLPQALSAALLIIVQPGASSPVLTLAAATGSTPASVTLASGTYDIFVAGQAGSTSSGLFGVVVTPTGGTSIYSKVVPIGSVVLLGSPALAAGNYTLKLADLSYPSALSALGAVVTLNGQAVGPPLTASGTQAIAATAGTYQVFAAGTGGSAGGSYTVNFDSQSGNPILDVARAVSAPGGTVVGYSFDTSIASGGTDTLDLTDFAFPGPFTTLEAAAVQGGALLAAGLDAAGSVSISTTSGPLSLIVFATPSSSAPPGGGLFGVDITTSAGPLFQATQGVGQLFATEQVSIAEAGSYAVTMSDVGFPESFQSLALVVTNGSNLIGKIYTAGTFTFSATPGNYSVSVLAQPQPPTAGTPDEAGTYAISVAALPPPPTATITTDASGGSVASGDSVHVIWSSKGATSCAASSSPAAGFSGTVATSGQVTSTPLSVSTNFSLTCAGAGGTSTPQSVTVTIAAPARSGGGGAIGAPTILVLTLLVLLRAARFGERSMIQRLLRRV